MIKLDIGFTRALCLTKSKNKNGREPVTLNNLVADFLLKKKEVHIS